SDAAARQRLLEDAGVAQALLVDRRDAGLLQGLVDDLAEDVGLGEALGADDQLVGRDCRGADEHEQQGRAPALHARSTSGLSGLGGLPAFGPKPRPAIRLSAARSAIARRVATVALAMCGVSTTL